MIQFATVIAAFLLDSAVQPPIVMQCPQPAQDIWWKWIIQTFIPVASGTLIAVWSFWQNRRSEQQQWERNQRTTHEQWIRDQQKAEWSGLLRTVGDIQRILRIVNTSNKDRIQGIIEELKPAVHELSVRGSSCVFLRKFFSNPANREKFYSFIRDADDTSTAILGMRELHRDPDFPLTEQEKTDLVSRILREKDRITENYLEFNAWLLNQASEDLGVMLLQESPR